MTTLKQQTARGVKWLLGSSFIQKALSVVTMVVLARILSPSVFGLFALAFVAIDALGLFKSMGFDSALIKRKENIEKAANTAFFIIPLLGLVLFLIMNVSAPYIGRFLNSQEVAPVMRVLGLIFIFSCFSMVPKALLQKDMRFARVASAEVGGAIVYSVVAISLALSGFGVWSLVVGYLAKTVIVMITIWHFAKWKPQFMFDKTIALEMFHFGKFLFLGSSVWFLKMNLDNLLVGKLLGITALGLYVIAFNIANFSADYLGSKVAKVVFPAYSKLQHDLNNLRSAVLKTLKYISLIAIPFSTTLFLLNREFLSFIYGSRWVDAASTLKILAWAGTFNVLPVAFGAVFLVCGKPKFVFSVITLQVALFFIFLAPAAKMFGINGIGVVVTLSGLIALLIISIYAMRLISLSLKQIYYSLRPSLISSLLMTLVIIFLKEIILRYQIIFFLRFNFILILIPALAVYTFSLFKIENTLFKEIKKLAFA